MKSLLPAAAFAVLVTPAVAQNTYFDFSGFHLSLSASQPTASSANNTDVDVDIDVGQAITAAYLFNVGDFVVGPDLSLRRGGYSLRGSVSDELDWSESSATLSAALGVRVGYPIGQVMPFVSARIGRGTDDYVRTLHFRGGDAQVGDTRYTYFDTLEWGIGAEAVLRESISLLVSYDRATVEYPGGLEIESDALSIGVGFRF